MNKQLMKKKTTGAFGGTLNDIPKPHIRKFYDYGKRRVRISIMRYSMGLHYYVSIEEEDNPLWDTSNPKKPLWRVPWKDNKGKGISIGKQFNTVLAAEHFMVQTLKKQFSKSKYRYDFETKETEFIYSKEGD